MSDRKVFDRACAIGGHVREADKDRRLQGWLIKGLLTLIFKCPNLDDARLREVCYKNYGLIESRTKTLGRTGGGSRALACARVLTDFYNQRLSAARRISIDRVK